MCCSSHFCRPGARVHTEHVVEHVRIMGLVWGSDDVSGTVGPRAYHAQMAEFCLEHVCSWHTLLGTVNVVATVHLAAWQSVHGRVPWLFIVFVYQVQHVPMKPFVSCHFII